MNKTNETISITRRIFGFFIILFSALTLVAIIFDKNELQLDYMRLAELNFSQLSYFDFASIINPIGIFGVFCGYWIVNIFGNILGISILFFLAVIGEITAFLKMKEALKRHIHIVLSLLSLMFFINLLILTIRGTPITFGDGIIPEVVYRGMYALFRDIGIYIISSILIFLSIFLVYDKERYSSLLLDIPLYIVKSIWISIVWIGKKIGFIFSLPFKKISKPKKKKKKVDEDDLPEESEPNFEEDYPSIIADEQAEFEDEESQNYDEIDLGDHFKITDKRDEDNTKETEKEHPKQKMKKKKIMKTNKSDEYQIPDIDAFLQSPPVKPVKNRKELQESIKETSMLLIQKLAEFGVEAEVVNVNIGPIISQFELKPAPGIAVKKFTSLADDLALAIKAESIRIQAPIPGRGLIGIEVPNEERDIIYLKDILASEKMQKKNLKLGIALGKDIAGRSVIADLTKMPHLLIAGATGAGKSVCINTIIASLLFREIPEDVRVILVDPKKVELAMYEEIPHIIQNVVTEPEDALKVFNWGVSEMERRYDLLKKYRVRSFGEYNKKLKKYKKNDETNQDDYLPYIVIIVDEFADLIMTAGKDIEQPITRLAQMARAIGIHLILATQRPSTKVITGIIKANFPARIAFRVSSKIDSRVILDSNGAEQLLGMGDMLFLEKSFPKRVHGAYVSTEEIEEVTDYLETQPKPVQEIEILNDGEVSITGTDVPFEFDDELFPKAACLVVQTDTASVSMMQRHFKIGYARAGRIVDLLDQAGAIGPHVGSKPRDVLWSEEDLKINGFMED
ncbi:MAG: DNA translocase FtsK [Candidatus Cloacimonadota bacterium]|nr:DNA translocase FtsK [Candidatus Cloacimonadota bacterium]